MSTLDPCGTYGAYTRHVKSHETPCDECRAANTAYKQHYRARPPSTDPSPAATPERPHPRPPTQESRHRNIPRLRIPVNRETNLDDAACLPWDGLHDSQGPRETDRDFQQRLAKARTICGTCPVLLDCRAQTNYYRRHQVRLDGIFAGRHYQYGAAI